ncbi:MAG: AAA family ATPase [Dissulfurispiraceae bacterium]|jgi:flagellar biosynthesis protein FlhF
MRIKKFVGGSFKEALETVKKELGSDAIILSSKSIKTGPFGMLNKEAVEVTVALDETDGASSDRAEKAVSSEMGDLLKEIKGLREEVCYLKETLRPIVPTLRVGKDKKGLFNLLLRQGVDTQFAMMLLERSTETLDSLKNSIKGDLKIQGLLPAEESGLIFLGPPGVGKTTTVSKVAHMFASKRKAVNLISLDADRIGAVASMKELSQQLKCPFRVVRRVSDLPKILYKEMRRGPMLIDTPGTEINNVLEDIKDIFPSGFPVKKCFLIDSAMNVSSALKTWQNCKMDMIDSIGFTKLDMATHYGSLYNISMLTSRPLSFITTGPGVPDDIRVPTQDFLAGLIIGGI